MTDLAQLYESAVLRWGDGDTRKATDLENQVHELQEQLYIDGPPADESLAFGVIEHIGGTFETEDAETAVEHLGKAMVCAAGYAYLHGLALSPILDLARALTRRDDVQPVHGMGKLAAVERADKADLVRVVAALGLCIAKGIDDCEILHGLTIEPRGVFLTIGREMLTALDRASPARKLGDDGTPHVPDTGPGAFKFPRDRISITKGNDETIEAFTARAVEFTTPVGFDPMRHISPLGICPQCAAMMTTIAIAAGPGASEARDTGYRCENGHELTSEQMDALLRVSTAPSNGS